MDRFTQGYVDCALWVFQLDGLGIDLPADLQAQAEEDCKAFQEANWEDVCTARSPEHAGHDFYLTRERHGAGYWDGDYPDDVGRRLTDAAHVYGEWTEFTAWAMEQQEGDET